MNPLVNCYQLLALVEDTPEHLVDMQVITSERACGTVHCLLGWAGTDPHFHAQGLRYVDGHLYLGKASESLAYWDERLQALFGGDVEALFAPPGAVYAGLYERGGKFGPWQTSKELAILRLKHHIKLLEAEQ